MSEWKEWEYTAPPMKPIIEQVVGQMHTEYENGAMKAVQEVGFNVDKDRLIQALTDARKFYEEGYRAAMRQSEWISVDERLPDQKGEYFVYSTFAGYGYRTIAFFSPCYDGLEEDMQGRRVWYTYDGEYGDCECHVTHWMPLPEPPVVVVENATASEEG